MKSNRQKTKTAARSSTKGRVAELLSCLSNGCVESSELDEPCRRIGLTPSQTKVMTRMFFGKTDKEIAAELGISYRTVNGHISDILRELGVTTRSAAIKVLIDVHFSCPHRSDCKLRFMPEIPPDNARD
jgi:DNA-binding NarL/FixJ family response regulator